MKVEDKKLMLETYLGVSDNSLHPVIAGSLDGQIEKAVYSLLEVRDIDIAIQFGMM